MKYILVMTLSGSIMTLFYFIIRKAVGEKVSAAWKFGMIKATVLYYLLPLPFLKTIYLEISESITKILGRYQGEVVGIYAAGSTVFFDGEKYYFNEPLQTQIWTVAIWGMVAAGILLFRCVRYLQVRRRLLLCRGLREAESDSRLADKLRKEKGIRRRICCFRYPEEAGENSGAFTFGFYRPVIMLPDVGVEEQDTLIMRHEMMHIKRKDAVWKILMSAAMIVHWYNPFVWWLNREMEEICEMSCDEAVLKNESDSVKRNYMELIISTAEKKRETSCRKHGWTFSLSREGEMVKRRICNMKNEKNHWKKSISITVAILAVCLNSLTVFAYDDVQYYAAEETPEKVFGADYIFVPNTMDITEVLESIWGAEPEIRYDVQFTDENGIIYPVEENVEMYAVCSHNYVSGTKAYHVKYSDGSCMITYYEAERCTKCGYVVQGKECGRNRYNPCPH